MFVPSPGLQPMSGSKPNLLAGTIEAAWLKGSPRSSYLAFWLRGTTVNVKVLAGGDWLINRVLKITSKRIADELTPTRFSSMMKQYSAIDKFGTREFLPHAI